MVESSLNNVSIRMSIEYLQLYFRHLCIPKFAINITILIFNLSIPQFKMVYILWSLYFSTYQFARESSHVADFDFHNKFLTQKLCESFFVIFYLQYYNLIFKFLVELKSLMQQGLSEPAFYGNFVYDLKKTVCTFSSFY